MNCPDGMSILCSAAGPNLPFAHFDQVRPYPHEMGEQAQTRGPSTRETTDDAPNHTCRICNRIYERADHLSRHMKSHANARPYQCSRCSKRFNRADLLNRHESTHDRHANNNGNKPLTKRADRDFQACHACASSKSKCEDQKPCKRCRTKGLQCEWTPTNHSGHRGSSAHAIARDAADPTQYPGISIPNGSGHLLPGETAPNVHQAKYGSNQTDTLLLGNDSNSMSHDCLMRLDRSLDYAQSPSPANIEHGHTNIQPELAEFDIQDDIFLLPNVTDFNQDVNFDFWDFNFSEIQLTTDAEPPRSTNNHKSAHSGTEKETRPSRRDLSQGYAAFKRSPWLWTPARKDHSLNDQDSLAVNEASISDALMPPLTDHALDDQQTATISIDCSLRDKMFALVVNWNKPRGIAPSFPSLDLLNHLIQVFCIHESYQADSWIHTPSLVVRELIPEFLIAIVAAGSSLISVPAVWKMGLALQEVVRLGVGDLIEQNNANTRDLRTVQSFMLYIEIGLWSGFKRKMEIAESFSQPLITMLRRAGVFAAPRDATALMPETGDSEAILDAKWKKWIQRESYKRLAIRLFLHDVQCSIGLQKTPLISVTELQFSMPGPRDLWFAATATEWAMKYSQKHPLPNSPVPRIIDGIHDTSLLDAMHDHVDVHLCCIAILHGFWGQIWAFRESSKFYLENRHTPEHTASRLWLTAQHRELLHDLEKFSSRLSDYAEQPVQMILIAELLVMMLYISPEELQFFAGKAGEEEARRASSALKKWYASPESRKAIWHAGQVLRTAKKFPPAELRGFYAIAVYFASLTLWVYGLMSGKSERHGVSGTSTPGQGIPRNRDRAVHVFIDGPETRKTRAFLSVDQGLPGLCSVNGPLLEPAGLFRALETPSNVLGIARDIYRNNFPILDEPLPPLVENLGNLMRDLGSLPGSRISRSGSEAH